MTGARCGETRKRWEAGRRKAGARNKESVRRKKVTKASEDLQQVFQNAVAEPVRLYVHFVKPRMVVKPSVCTDHKDGMSFMY